MNRLRTAMIVLLFTAGSALDAQSTDPECSVPINGALRGGPGNIQDHMFHSLAIDPTNENIVYAGTETNGVFKTIDGGTTWTRLRAGLKCGVQKTGYPQIFDIAIDPTDTKVLYASTINGPGPASPTIFPSASAGIYKSTDGGLTWTQKNKGLTNTYVTYVLVDATRPNRLYAGVGGGKSSFPLAPGVFYDGGVWASDDGAESWSPLPMPAGVPTNALIDMVLRGANQRTIYASAQPHGADAPIAYGFLRSNDGGQTWAIVNPRDQTISGFDAFRGDPNIVYGHDLSPGRGVHRSTDGGNTWTALPAGFYGVLRIHPTNSQTMYFTGRTSILKTVDGFASQQEVYSDPDLPSFSQMVDIKISLTNPNVVWAAAKGYYLYKTADGGKTWRKITAIRDLVYGQSSSTLIVNAIVNAASNDASALAPGSLASIYGVFPGVNPAQGTTSSWPTMLAGVGVTFNGTPAALSFASATQLNVQVPRQMAGQARATVVVSAGGQSSEAREIAIAGAAPGIFQTVSQQGIVTDALTGQLISSSNPARRGSYLTIYCTGLGEVLNQPENGAASSPNVLAPTVQLPVVTIGGVAASVDFSGLTPGFPGLYQVNVRVPAPAPAGDRVPLSVAIAGRTANPVNIAIIP